MGSTTIRVDAATHAQLVALSRERDTSITETVRETVDALRRQRFARRVATELEVLRGDPPAWRQYVTDAESTSVADGIER